MDNDEYSLAILAKYGFIEYEIDAQDEEKIARCKEYIADVKSEERRKWLIFIIPLIFFISTIVLMIVGIGLVVLSMSRI